MSKTLGIFCGNGSPLQTQIIPSLRALRRIYKEEGILAFTNGNICLII